MKKKTSSSGKNHTKKSKSVSRTKLSANKNTDTLSIKNNISVIGIGASAGGLEAIIALLKNFPTDLGVSFVIIQHMEANRGSLLDEILSRNTAMPVCFAQNKQRLLANHIYIIPPLRNANIFNGEFNLTKLNSKIVIWHPIDAFFKILAQTYGNKLVGIILSGTGSDGVFGLKEIKALGGITFAQDEQTAQYPDMPHNAIASGNVDIIMRPEDIGKKCAEISNISSKFTLGQKKAPGIIPHDAGKSFELILDLLMQYSGVNFPEYKHPTLSRRIERRMMLLMIDTVEKYLAYIKNNKLELKELFEDVLINVTNFFRDPKAFVLLNKKVFPLIAKNKLSKNPIRIWVAGVASGEEAYSIAIQIAEFFKTRTMFPEVQIFGTDISEKALAQARRGLYNDNIKTDISPNILRQYFTQTEEGFKIKRSIRDMCVFARHDLTRDPPFCNMDLISCRNVLIYFGNSLQKIVLPMFHYALKPKGMLLLSDSEGVGSFTDLFNCAEKKYKLFSKKPGSVNLNQNYYVPFGNLYQGEPQDAMIPVNKTAFEDGELSDVSRILLNRYVATSILINSDLELLQSWGDISWCIQHKSGKATLNILQLVDQGLVNDMRSLILEAFKQKQKTTVKNIQFLYHDEVKYVDIEAIPIRLRDKSGYYLLIVFKETSASANKNCAEVKAVKTIIPKKSDDAKNKEIVFLKESVKKNKEYLQSVIEKSEATSEELKSSLEELQSTNEELRSTNEELQTAKEELQSTNEELKTMNDEVSNQNIELNTVNNDILNLLNCINIPIIMVGRDLCIRRFNHVAEKFLSLIPRDVGRRITDIQPKLEITDLEKMIIDVLEELKIQEREIQDKNGRWQLIQIRPYKTSEHKIEGAVITLIDIDNVRKTAELERLATVIRDSNDSVLLVDFKGKIIAWNKGAEKIYGWNEREALSMSIFELIPPENIKQEKARIKRIQKDEMVDSFETKRIDKNKSILDVWVTVTLLKDNSGHPVAFSLTERNTTKMRLIQEKLLQSEKMSAMGNIAAGVAHELNSPLAGLKLMINSYAKKIKPGTSEAENFFDMHNACEYMGGIISELSFFAKPQKEPVGLLNVNEEIESVLKLITGKIKEKSIKIKKDFEENIHQISGHKREMHQMVLNLINNACDSMSNNGKLIIKTRNADNNKIKIEFIDNGQGIKRENLEKVFEPFFTTKTGKKGSGLGLAIVKSLVASHNGTISVDSKKDKGTNFTLTFPSIAKIG